jgi:hypothetical protein
MWYNIGFYELPSLKVSDAVNMQHGMFDFFRFSKVATIKAYDYISYRNFMIV